MSTRYFHATKSEIERLCGYITDDGAIAAYYGIDRADVAKVRRDVVKATPHQRFKAERYVRHAPQKKEGTGLQQAAEDRILAKDGSERLCDAMHLAFQRHTDRYGIRSVNGLHPDEVSKLLLMNCAVRP